MSKNVIDKKYEYQSDDLPFLLVIFVVNWCLATEEQLAHPWTPILNFLPGPVPFAPSMPINPKPFKPSKFEPPLFKPTLTSVAK